jgi:hypothetical protein
MRRELVRLAGSWAHMSAFSRYAAVEFYLSLAQYSRALRSYTWGPPEPGPRVAVPRSLRRHFGRELEL